MVAPPPEPSHLDGGESGRCRPQDTHRGGILPKKVEAGLQSSLRLDVCVLQDDQALLAPAVLSHTILYTGKISLI
jgi:hypothetical protein